MAEILLKAVLSKLGQFSVETILSLCNVNEKVEKFKSLCEIENDVKSLSEELKYIQGCIVDADKKRIVDKTQKIWVRDLMDIAYQIENAVEIFLLEYPEKLPGVINDLKEEKVPCCIINCTKRWQKEIKKIPFLWNFYEEIKRIQRRIDEIKEFKEKYKIITLGEDKIPEFDSEVSLDPIDNPDVVGFAKDREEIVKRLLDKNVQELAIVSIVGIGGLGKTTLALKVFNCDKVIKRFNKPIWITISQKYELLHVLGKLAEELEIDSTGKNEHDLAKLIRRFLSEREKPYLIVLDDVWTEKLWREIANVLPDTKKGSRALITTRNENVINKAGVQDAAHIYDPYKPSLLSEKESIELLIKKAVPRDRQCPDPHFNYKDLARQFAKKCGGLPLALIVLGGLLRTTQPFDFHTWNELLETMSWQTDENECTKIISTSYEHLPFAKKLCFLYFAAFPEDKIIEVKPLLRIWIADGLIPDDERRTLEQTAECFLKDLVHRSMVQVVESCSDGSVKYCRVHDVLRDLAVLEARENNFLKVCSKLDDWKNCKAHRVAIHNINDAKLIDIERSSTVRSLLVFGYGSSKLDCSKYSVLRVLGCMEGNVDCVSFKGSRLLRYVQLTTNCKHRDGSTETECAVSTDQLGNWIKSMNYLETLDLRKSRHGDLSNSIWETKTLRHVLLSTTNTSRRPWYFLPFSTPGPTASVEPMNLRTLKIVIYNKLWEKQSGLPNIPQLRELGIAGGFGESEKKIETLTRLLGMLNHLVYLEMTGEVDVLQKIPFQSQEKLKFLYLYNSGRNTKNIVLDDGMLPPYLLELHIENCNFGSDPMAVLEKLGSLKILSIHNANSKCDMIIFRCSSGGFKQLEVLDLKDIPAAKWEIQIGAMPMLKRLRVNDCDPLPLPDELILQDMLPSLRYLDWRSSIMTNNVFLSKIFIKRSDLKSSGGNSTYGGFRYNEWTTGLSTGLSFV